MSSLPPGARPHLELQLDRGHEGVESDLYEIAEQMLRWVEMLSAPLGLMEVDVHDITKGIHSLVLQHLHFTSSASYVLCVCRREALRRWKSKQAHKATYGNLLELFVKARHTQCAEAVVKC